MTQLLMILSLVNYGRGGMSTKITLRNQNDVDRSLLILIHKKIGALVPHDHELHINEYQGVYELFTTPVTGSDALDRIIVGDNLSDFIDKILKFDYFPKGWFK